MDRGVITIGFDDNLLSDYRIAFKEMRKRGWLGVSWSVTDWMNRLTRLSWDTARRMHRKGWDIQCHTYSHPRLGDLQTEQEVRDQLEKNNEGFIENGLPIPENIAYPNGSSSTMSRQITSEYRVFGRGTAGTEETPANDWNNLNMFNLVGVGIDMDDEVHLNRVKAAIDKCEQEKTWLILYGHRIREGGGNLTADTDLFIQMLNYIDTKNVRVMKGSEVYDNFINSN